MIVNYICNILFDILVISNNNIFSLRTGYELGLKDNLIKILVKAFIS